MTRLNFIVEGQTEETFVRDVLAPQLGERGVYAFSRCVETGRKHGQIYRGGMTSYGRAKRDIQRWLAQEKTAFVTTMFDYYRLPTDFPKALPPPGGQTPSQRAEQIEAAFAVDIADARFIPYIQMHEFEALLFADVPATAKALGVTPQQTRQLDAVAVAFETPEHIDEGVETAPSKRLRQVVERYDKPFFGSIAVQAADFGVVRQRCAHFAAWLTRLESLAGTS